MTTKITEILNEVQDILDRCLRELGHPTLWWGCRISLILWWGLQDISDISTKLIGTAIKFQSVAHCFPLHKRERPTCFQSLFTHSYSKPVHCLWTSFRSQHKLHIPYTENLFSLWTVIITPLSYWFVKYKNNSNYVSLRCISQFVFFRKYFGDFSF